MNRKRIFLGSASALIIPLCASALLAQSFSVDAPTGLPPDDIFGPGPGVPVLIFPGGGAPPVEVDAFSYHTGVFVPDGVNFSVERGSVGAAASAVAAQFAIGAGEQVADIYFAGGTGTNILILDGNGLTAPTAPPLGLVETDSNLDALDATPTPPPAGGAVYFSVDPGTVMVGGAYAATGFSPADVFSTPGVPGYAFPAAAPPVAAYATEAALGLVPGDDINGLHYMEDGTPGASGGDMVYFSLALGSPTLGIIGASASDVLLVSPAPPAPVPAVAPGFGFAAIGLAMGDDLNALHMHVPGAGLPVQLRNFNVE